MSSARASKAKGRKGQDQVATLIEDILNIDPDVIHKAIMGSHGCDVFLDKSHQHLFPFAVEVKVQEKLNIWDALKQAETNKGNLDPILFFKRNRTKMYVALEAEHFLQLVHVLNSSIQVISHHQMDNKND